MECCLWGLPFGPGQQRRESSQAPIKSEAGAGAAFPPLAGAHTCQGTALDSPASSLQAEFNQHLPVWCPEQQSQRVKRKEKRAPLAAILPAVPGGAAWRWGTQWAALFSAGTELPSASADSSLCLGPEPTLKAAQRPSQQAARPTTLHDRVLLYPNSC